MSDDGTRRIAVCREYTFDAAHLLEWHKGKCRHLHGHTYRLQVWVEGTLDERGVVMDFGELDEYVEGVVDLIDHRYLNDILENPTAERIALWILRKLTNAGLKPSEVRLWETPRSAVSVKSSPSP